MVSELRRQQSFTLCYSELHNHDINLPRYLFDSHQLCESCQGDLSLADQHPHYHYDHVISSLASGPVAGDITWNTVIMDCVVGAGQVEVIRCEEGFIYKFRELPDCDRNKQLCLGR